MTNRIAAAQLITELFWQHPEGFSPRGLRWLNRIQRAILNS